MIGWCEQGYLESERMPPSHPSLGIEFPSARECENDALVVVHSGYLQKSRVRKRLGGRETLRQRYVVLTETGMLHWFRRNETR